MLTAAPLPRILLPCVYLCASKPPIAALKPAKRPAAANGTRAARWRTARSGAPGPSAGGLSTALVPQTGMLTCFSRAPARGRPGPCAPSAQPAALMRRAALYRLYHLTRLSVALDAPRFTCSRHVPCAAHGAPWYRFASTTSCASSQRLLLDAPPFVGAPVLRRCSRHALEGRLSPGQRPMARMLQRGLLVRLKRRWRARCVCSLCACVLNVHKPLVISTGHTACKTGERCRQRLQSSQRGDRKSGRHSHTRRVQRCSFWWGLCKQKPKVS